MIETIRKMDSDISKEVLLTMQVVPRDKFVEETPFGNHPVAIGSGQTISQPFIVAYMTHKLNIKSGHKTIAIKIKQEIKLIKNTKTNDAKSPNISLI